MGSGSHGSREGRAESGLGRDIINRSCCLTSVALVTPSTPVTSLCRYRIGPFLCRVTGGDYGARHRLLGP